MENQNPVVKKPIVAGAVSAMVWGIVSIVTLYLFGWVASIVAFSLRRKALELYESNPSEYNEKSLNFLKTAKICATIGLWVSIGTTILFIAYIALIVTLVSSHSYYY